MAVITISTELGSGGFDISQQVAKRLGYDFVDKHTVDGIFRQYGLTKFDALYSSVPGILDLVNYDNLLIISMLNEIIQAVAQRGNVVILGRGGFAVLEDYADVLNVRTGAPFAVRVQRVMEREGLTDLQQTEERVREADNVRQRFIQIFYARRWDDDSQFDLVLDTGSITPEMAIDRIIADVRALEQKGYPADAPMTTKIEVDPVLADALAKVMAYPLPALPT